MLGWSMTLAASLQAAPPAAKFPRQPRERLSVSTYPFRSVIAAGTHDNAYGPAQSGMRLEQFAATLKAKFDVPGIEPWSRHFESTDADYIHTLRRAFDQAGIHVVNIPVDVKVNLCGSPDQQQTGLATYRKWIDAAVILGSPGIRVHLPGNGKANDMSCAVTTLKALAQSAESRNVVVNLENDNPKTELPEHIAEVIKAVDSSHLRALPDFCNSMLIHNDQTYNDRAMDMLFPLAFNISHVKDLEQDEGKTYRVDVNRIFAIAKKHGYAGYFSMEWEGTGDPYEGTKKLIAESLRNLS